ncbi:MAG: ATP-binding protein [Acholeplasmataceae bacterium]|nr:ATP-binding protein [Acholeplasmataceae bacterium]
MRKNQVTTIVIEIAIGLLLLLGLLFGILRYNTEQNMIEMGKTIAYSTLKSYENTTLSDSAFVSTFNTQNKHIAIVSRSGDVLANSNPTDKLENPLTMEEFMDIDSPIFRYSENLEKKMLYIVLESRGNFIRVSISMSNQLNRYHTLALYATLLGTVFLIFMVTVLNLERRKYQRDLSTLLLDIHNKQTNSSYQIKETEYDDLNEIIWLLNKIMPVTNIDSKETLRILLNEMNQGILLVNSNQEIVLTNKISNDLLNLKEGEKVMFQIRDKDVYESISEATKKNINKTITLDYKDKHVTVLVKSVQSPLLSKNTNKLGVLVILVDDTERYILDKNKRDFFANASHELRSPLTSISGSAELINLDMVNLETQKQLSQQIMDNVNIMNNLINDMLELSKLQSNPPKIYHKNNLKQIMAQTIENLKFKLEEKMIDLKLDLDELDYIGSEQDFRSLFKNLIENAIKYNKLNGAISISLKQKGPGFTFIVKDTGIGISKENQARVFERFYQVDKDRNLSLMGTGLGLSIVKHIVILYKGTIRLESALDEGTTITVELP